MRKIQDRVTLGLVSGTLGGVVALALGAPLAPVVGDAVTWVDRAKALTLSRKHTKARGAGTIGMITSVAICSLEGVAQTYVLSLTGRDSRLGKAAVTGVLAWLGAQGLGRMVTVSPATVNESGVSLLRSLVSAVVASEAIARLGDPRLFGGQALPVWRTGTPLEVRPATTPRAQAVEQPAH